MGRFCTSISISFIGLTLLFAFSCEAQVVNDFQTKSAAGNWSDFNAWNRYNGSAWVFATSGQLPTSTSNVFVQAGHTISVDNASAVCNTLNVNGSIASKIAFTTAASVLSVNGNMVLFSTSHNCFSPTWIAGAKMLFSGTGAQGFTNLSASSIFISIEVNKASGTLTTSSNLRFGTFTLTAGNFTVSSAGNEIQGNSAMSSININGGTWTQTATTTKINNSGTVTSPIGALTINGGTMILASSGDNGFKLSTINVINGGVLTYASAGGNLSIATSISVDATSTFNTAHAGLTLPSGITFNGLVNYNNLGNQIINSATYSYLKLNGTGVKTLGGATNISPNGKLEMSGVAPSPTLTGGTLGVSATGTTLIYSSSANQTATSAEWKTDFFNVTVKSGATVTMSSLSRIINGTLNLTSGTLNIGANGSLGLNGPLVSTTGLMAGTNTSTLNITGVTGGLALLPVVSPGSISLQDLTLSGNRILQMNGTSNISLSGNFSIASNATYDNDSVSQINGGTSINVLGKFITRHPGGFCGSGTAITSTTVILTLASSSTVEYGLLGDQTVQGGSLPLTSAYSNVTFSGSGIKTLAGANLVTGTILVTGPVIFNARDKTFGGASTNLTMTGTSVYKNSGSGTKPDAQGTYILGVNTTIKFDSTFGTIIRLGSPINYANIVDSGINVSNASLGTGIAFQSGGSFLVRAGATFNLADTLGFSGNVKTAISNVNSPAIVLETGSTVNYNGVNQLITNQTGLPYQNLSISGTGNKTAPSGILTVQGNLIKSGTSTFLPNGGTVLLNGAAQSFAGLTYNNLMLSNGNTKTTSGTSTIIDSLKIATLTTLQLAGSDSIILHSDAAKTARVGQVDGLISYGGSGGFVVERFISAKRAWRFLSVPTNTSQNFNTAWQEGKLPGTNTQTTPPGYGTQITDKVPAGTNGFDYYSPNGPSVKKYDAATNSWKGIMGTNIAMQTSEGLMTFVRGDRTAKGFYAPATTAVLRTKGTLYTGLRPAIIIAAGKFVSIGNPYASAIDMRTIQRTFGSVDSFFYVWDPKLAGSLGFGSFQTFTQVGGNYFPTPGGGSYAAGNVPYNLIASGAAFFVHGKTGGSGGTLTMQETDKSYNDLALVFRPVNILKNNLYAINSDSSADLVDGVLNIVGDNFSNAVDEKDAIKMLNFSENLAIKKEEKLLAVEQMHTILGRDTIHYNLTKVKAADYRFEVVANNFNNEGLKANFEDAWLNTKTPVDLNGNTIINFKVSTDSGSWNPDRFSMTFEYTRKSLLPISNSNSGIGVYPNPISAGEIHLHFNEGITGNFNVKLLSTTGHSIMSKDITHVNGSTEIIKPGGKIPKGIYVLKVTDDNKNEVFLKIIN